MSVIKFVVYVKIIFSKVFDKSWITLCIIYISNYRNFTPYIYIKHYYKWESSGEIIRISYFLFKTRIFNSDIMLKLQKYIH